MMLLLYSCIIMMFNIKYVKFMTNMKQYEVFKSRFRVIRSFCFSNYESTAFAYSV